MSQESTSSPFPGNIVSIFDPPDRVVSSQGPRATTRCALASSSTAFCSAVAFSSKRFTLPRAEKRRAGHRCAR